MSDILACPNCDGPLTDSWLERAMDGSSGKRCEACTKAYHNPYGAAAELPLRRRQLVEAGNELARMTGDLEKATTALEAAESQIAALKIEVAAMMKAKDDAEAIARIAWKTLIEVNENHEAEIERLGIDHADTLVMLNAQREKFERDAEQSRAELANMQKERDEAVQERDHNLLLSGDISCMETDKPGCGYCNSCLRDQCDFAVQRADAAEEKLRAAEEEIATLRGENERLKREWAPKEWLAEQLQNPEFRRCYEAEWKAEDQKRIDELNSELSKALHERAMMRGRIEGAMDLAKKHWGDIKTLDEAIEYPYSQFMKLIETNEAIAINAVEAEEQRDAAIARAEAAEAQGEAMRVEIAQLTESGVAMVDRWDEERKAHARTRHERDALREEAAQVKAKLGCTVAALLPFVQAQWRPRRLINDMQTMTADVSPNDIAIARSVYGDSDSAAAGDYVRELEAVYEAAKRWRGMAIELDTALAVVDARREIKDK